MLWAWESCGLIARNGKKGATYHYFACNYLNIGLKYEPSILAILMIFFEMLFSILLVYEVKRFV